MSPDDRRVLFIVLAVVGFLSCGCLCLPFGAALSLPVIANLRKAAQKVQAERERKQWVERAAARPRFTPPRPPAFNPPGFNPSVVPGEVPPGRPPIGMPPGGFAPPDFPVPPPIRTPPVPRRPPGIERPGGLGALTEAQRQFIYRSATSSAEHNERMQEMVERQMESRKQRNLDTSHLERASADRGRLYESQLEGLCRIHRISRDELKQIIDEGKRKNW